MVEVDGRIFELKKAAIACGLEPDLAVDDISESCRVAEQALPDSDENRAARWWPAFLKDYSVRCVGRWQVKCGNLKNDDEMEKAWLEIFEPLWLAGCNYIKDLAIQNVRSGYNKVTSKHTDLDVQDLQKVKQYFNNVADDLDKVISAEITKFTTLQSSTLSKVIRQRFPKDE
jgi:hypothetical protein